MAKQAVRNRGDELLHGVMVPGFALYLLYECLNGKNDASEFEVEVKLTVLAVLAVAVSMMLPSLAGYARRFARWVYGQVAAEFRGPPSLVLPAGGPATPLRRADRHPLASAFDHLWNAVDAFYVRRGIPWAPVAFAVGAVIESALLVGAFAWPVELTQTRHDTLVLMAKVYGGGLLSGPPLLAAFGPWVGRLRLTRDT